MRFLPIISGLFFVLSASALPKHKGAPKDTPVDIDAYSGYSPCVKQCVLDNLHHWDLSHKTQHQLCKTQNYQAQIWDAKYVEPCMRRTCSLDHLRQVICVLQQFTRDFCGWKVKGNKHHCRRDVDGLDDNPGAGEEEGPFDGGELDEGFGRWGNITWTQW